METAVLMKAFWKHLLSSDGEVSMTRFGFVYAIFLATIIVAIYILHGWGKEIDWSIVITLWVGITGPFAVTKLIQKPMEK